MKRYFFIIISFILTLSLSSCHFLDEFYTSADSEEILMPGEILITDIKEYDTIWIPPTPPRVNEITLADGRTFEYEYVPRRMVGKACVLFPDTVDEEQCIEFKYKYRDGTYSSFWQVSLEMRYDDEEFFAEVERLKALCTDSPICGNSEYFEYPAYATVWNWNGCFEYAVVDEKEKTVGYIYLQLKNSVDLTIHEKYIPKGYAMALINCEIYSTYE